MLSTVRLPAVSDKAAAVLELLLCQCQNAPRSCSLLGPDVLRPCLSSSNQVQQLHQHLLTQCTCDDTVIALGTQQGHHLNKARVSHCGFGEVLQTQAGEK
jgi:hypothetical protein